jgi:hypothetical protein
VKADIGPTQKIVSPEHRGKELVFLPAKIGRQIQNNDDVVLDLLIWIMQVNTQLGHIRINCRVEG